MQSGAGTVSLGIKDLRAEVGDHIALFWENESEFHQALGFLDLGIHRGDYVVVFGHDDANARVLEGLRSRGHDLAALQREGRAAVLGAETTGELMLSRIGETFQAAVSGGASLIRLLGNIGWGRDAWPKESDILRFEARVTSAAAAFPCVVVCMYDVQALSGSAVLHGALGTHPLTIYHNMIRENPMCLGVDEFLERLDAGSPASE